MLGLGLWLGHGLDYKPRKPGSLKLIYLVKVPRGKPTGNGPARDSSKSNFSDLLTAYNQGRVTNPQEKTLVESYIKELQDLGLDSAIAEWQRNADALRDVEQYSKNAQARKIAAEGLAEWDALKAKYDFIMPTREYLDACVGVVD